MRNKILMSGILAVLMMSVALAASTSLRGTGGNVNFIGTDWNINASKIAFSANNNANISHLTLQAIGVDNAGKRIVLNVQTTNGVGTATYFKQGVTGPVRLPVSVVYTYNMSSGLTEVNGLGGINFKVTNIPTTALA